MNKIKNKCPCREFKKEWTAKDEAAFQLGENSKSNAKKKDDHGPSFLDWAKYVAAMALFFLGLLMGMNANKINLATGIMSIIVVLLAVTILSTYEEKAK